MGVTVLKRTSVQASPGGCFVTASRLNLTSLFPPAALLGLGIALPHVVNLHYISPEIFVYEVRAFGCDQRGLVHLWRKAGLGEAGITSLPPSLLVHAGGLGSARPGSDPCSHPDHAMNPQLQ